MPKKRKPKHDAKWFRSLNVPKKLDSREYEFSGDREALATLKAIPGAGWVCSQWVEFLLEFRRASFLGTTVKVSAKQFPEVDRLRRKCAQVLSMPAPPVFIVEHPVINAYTMGSDHGNSFIAVTRPLVEAATEKELTFILGHEMGHIKSQHMLYATLAIYLANMGLFYGMRFPPIHLLTYPIELALKAWFRRSEVTCDRAGLVCVQDTDVALRALLLMGCCSRELADRMDLDEFRQQSEEVSKSYGRWNEVFSTHPYLPKRVKCLEIFARSEVYQRKLLKKKSGKTLDIARVDRACANILGNKDADLDKPPKPEGPSEIEKRLQEISDTAEEVGRSAAEAARGTGADVLRAIARGLEAASRRIEKKGK